MNKIDLTGQRFGKLTVIAQYSACKESPNRELKWVCKCDCGKIKIVRGSNLRQGKVKSCGHCGVRKGRGNNYKKKYMPSDYCRKYGCQLCAYMDDCVEVYNEFGSVYCKFADILDQYPSYAAYDRAKKAEAKKYIVDLRRDGR